MTDATLRSFGRGRGIYVQAPAKNATSRSLAIVLAPASPQGLVFYLP